MHIRLVEDFLDICRTGAFSVTAKNRFLTQPTLSRHIQQLEDWIGAPLINRERRPVTLTAEGEAFVPIANEMVKLAKKAKSRLLEPVEPRAYVQPLDSGHEVEDTVPSGEPKDGDQHVLIVDDEMLSLRAMTKLVRDAGRSPISCSTSTEALEHSLSKNIALIISDYVMPEMDGATFATKVRETEAARGQPRKPIVAISASTDLAMISNCFSSGMDDYLSKPVGRTEIAVMLDRWVPQAATVEDAERRLLDSETDLDISDRELLEALCDAGREQVLAIAAAIEVGEAASVADNLASLRDGAFMAGAFSFGRTCMGLAKATMDGDVRRALLKRGPFLCEFVRLERAVFSNPVEMSTE